MIDVVENYHLFRSTANEIFILLGLLHNEKDTGHYLKAAP